MLLTGFLMVNDQVHFTSKHFDSTHFTETELEKNFKKKKFYSLTFDLRCFTHCSSVILLPLLVCNSVCKAEIEDSVTVLTT